MTLVLSSTGHAGMECVMTNLLEKDDVVLIANHGIWGERAMDMARRQVLKSQSLDILYYTRLYYNQGHYVIPHLDVTNFLKGRVFSRIITC